MDTITAAILKDPEYDHAAMTERPRWRVALSSGRRTFTSTRREAIAWCEEHQVPFVVAQPVRPLHQRRMAAR